MDDVWFGPGLTRGDFDACLRALALNARSEPPLLAVAIGEGERATLVLASRALFELFGVATSEALADRLLGGVDPGAQRLGALLRTLPLEGAPRLERLRFSLAPRGEVITFLCRRLKMASGQLVLVAAALGVRARLAAGRQAEAAPAPKPASKPASTVAVPPSSDAPRMMTHEVPAETASSNEPAPDEAIRALRARLPQGRAMRFLWQTDQQMVCTQVTPPLEAVAGHDNADLVGRRLDELAPRIDPSGRLAEALASRATWSGLEVHWPISDAAGAVAVTLGAIPAFDRDRAFEGYRGFGVVYPDRVVARAPARLTPAPEPSGKIVRFPGARFSPEDQIAFDELGAKLRDHAGLCEPAPIVAPATPRIEQPELELLPAEAVKSEHGGSERIADAAPVAADTTPAPEPPASSEPPREHENGLAVLDRLALGLLVSRDNVPIFANRHLLDLLGFADEDALHEAGGLSHVFGGQPGNVTGSEAVGVRTRDGTILRASARMQRIDWDGLPATLLTVQAAPQEDVNRDADQEAAVEAATEAAIEAMARDHREDRRRDASELRELRAILETATDGVAVIDPAGDILSLNRSGEALLGCERGQVIGKPFLDLFAPENRDLANGYLDDLKAGSTRSLLNDGRELRLKPPQGGTIPVFMTLGRLDPGDAAVEGGQAAGARFCALFRDLTHWKKVEGELETAKLDAERASALKSDFLAKVSHEVRTPLNAIIGFAEVIMEERFGPVGNERYKDYLRDIHASGTHVMSLVNDLLDLSKIEAGRLELDVTAIDANKIIGECVGLMQPMASRERVIMRQSLASGLPMIKADERSLRQILLNLLSNAIKFNEPGGQVIVATAAPEDGKVVIRIRDTGPGMSDADIAAALEPFRQVSSNSRSATTGTGLGLPLTKALVEANEAAFTIRSKVDQGTLVEVAFPAARVLAG